MARSKAPRLWRTFSLRALLATLTLVAIWCAFHANRGRYERGVEREVTSLGARVLIGTYDPATGKAFAPTSYERFLMIAFGQRFISEVEVSNATLPSGFIDRALLLPHLASFAATDCAITDDDLRNLPRATGLMSLHLPQNPVTDRGLAGLDRLVHLRWVNLGGTDIGDATLHRLARLPQLETVTIGNTRITGKNLTPFASSTTLKRFTGDNTKLSDDFLIAVAHCTQLEQLWLQNCECTDEGVMALANHPSIAFVFLNGNQQLTDKSLEVLADIPRLQRIGMSSPGITRSGVRKFRESRPNVKL